MEQKTKKRLVVVSNRLPFNLSEKKGKVLLQPSDGGLVSALKSYFDRDDNNHEFTEKLWVGSADFSEKRWEKYSNQENNEQQSFSIDPVFVESKLYNKYYNGFCNATLWPLFHYFSTYSIFDNDLFEAYEQVNQQFADRISALLQPNDVLWVHDYQLFLLPQMVREKKPHANIGFFLHIPFPSFEIFRLLHQRWRKKIVQGILGADLIGFHTNEYVQHFLKTTRMVMGYDHNYRNIVIGNRVIRVDLFPLGIDYKKFNEPTPIKTITEHKNLILENFKDKRIIFSVDRLDYTKGLTHRLTGFEYFLEMHPQWHQRVVFIFVVVPSREIISKYNERKNLLEEQVGRINGKYSTLQWQPILYRYGNLSFEELSALYQVADIALITPLRDGMNLVAKEYVASKNTQRGVLILSELAGAANELGEALMVNPMDKVNLANTIQEGLLMPVAMQHQKMVLMQKRLVDYDVQQWVIDFLTQLKDVKTLQASRVLKFVTKEIRAELVASYRKAKSRYLFLDYDGTLVPFAKLPHEAQPNKALMRLLEQLGSEKKTQLTIISGRDSGVLNEWFGKLPLNLVAEHGASIKRKGKDWMHEKAIDQTWKPLVKPTFELFVQRCPGAFIEEKSHTLAWHYRNVEAELGFLRSRDLLDTLLHLVRGAQLQVIDGNKVIEVRVAGVDKGVAARKLLGESPSDFVLVIGDDKTDEDMFLALTDEAVTIKVGPGVTQAKYMLPTQQDVLQFLNKLLP